MVEFAPEADVNFGDDIDDEGVIWGNARMQCAQGLEMGTNFCPVAVAVLVGMLCGRGRGGCAQSS